MIKLDYRHVLNFISNEDIIGAKDRTMTAFNTLINKTGAGNEYLGWVDYPLNFNQDEINRIKLASEKIRKTSDCLVVIGIGGSYLGAKAAIDLLGKYFQNDFEIIFVGNTLSSTYLIEVLEYLKTRDFAINVISKSGTTTEPAIAFRLFKDLLYQKYGDAARERIYITTDPETGVLRKLVNEHGCEAFSVPTDIGGRYSVLTAVGLLPIACAGIDIDELLRGARDAVLHFKSADFLNNEAMLYATIRNLLYEQGRFIEVFVSYEPKLAFFSEWLKQLFAESEGKDQRGIYPSALTYTTSLHSVGQYIQDGSRILFETVINFLKPDRDQVFIADEKDIDGLNYLAGKSLHYVNEQAMFATIIAHVEGGVPNILIDVDENSPYNLGYLFYFYMFSCGISGYLLGVNPFNQEGVEAYKRNMFALLGKPGYEDLYRKLKGK